MNVNIKYAWMHEGISTVNIYLVHCYKPHIKVSILNGSIHTSRYNIDYSKIFYDNRNFKNIELTIQTK